MIILKGQVPHTTHSYTKHSHTKKTSRKRNSRQQKKAKYTSIKQHKAILALSCLIIYILFHPLKKHKAKLIEDFETRNTVKFSLSKEYKASKGFGGTGE